MEPPRNGFCAGENTNPECNIPGETTAEEWNIVSPYGDFYLHKLINIINFYIIEPINQIGVS